MNMSAAISISAKRMGVPQFLFTDCGSAFRLTAECQLTGRLALLYTPDEPQDADYDAVLRKLSGEALTP